MSSCVAPVLLLNAEPYRMLVRTRTDVLTGSRKHRGAAVAARTDVRNIESWKYRFRPTSLRAQASVPPFVLLREPKY
eukprot:6051252-Prymnesium_polylepis.2